MNKNFLKTTTILCSLALLPGISLANKPNNMPTGGTKATAINYVDEYGNTTPLEPKDMTEEEWKTAADRMGSTAINPDFKAKDMTEEEKKAMAQRVGKAIGSSTYSYEEEQEAIEKSVNEDIETVPTLRISNLKPYASGEAGLLFMMNLV